MQATETEKPQGQDAAPSPAASTSQAFHRELPTAVLKRSLICAALASTVGMIFFGIVQGTVLNFFLEDLSLKDRIPWFFGLQWLFGAGSIVGSWLQENYGRRRLIFYLGCGLSRLIWLLVDLMPLLWPEKIKSGELFWPMSFCIAAFSSVRLNVP